jgi:predicted transport protein
MENYLIVLFKNKVRYKILKKYITFKKAKNYFDVLKKENQEIIFDKLIVDGQETTFEIGLVEKSSSQLGFSRLEGYNFQD